MGKYRSEHERYLSIENIEFPNIYAPILQNIMYSTKRLDYMYKMVKIFHTSFMNVAYIPMI